MSAAKTRAFAAKVHTGLVKENATNKGLERIPLDLNRKKAL
jgi:hypothetical protein